MIKWKKIIQDTINKKKSKNKLYTEAFAYNSNIDYSVDSKIIISDMTYTCSYCKALKFEHEKPGMCCSNGKVQLPNLIEPPEPLKSYMSNNSNISKHFLSNIYKYNDIFKMTSFGATKILNQGCYLPTFIIQGIKFLNKYL